jgi:pimeloyl-ACP methyl ester carboxylesterase
MAVEAAEGVPVADIARQTFPTYLAEVIVHFEHDVACAFSHKTPIITSNALNYNGDRESVNQESCNQESVIRKSEAGMKKGWRITLITLGVLIAVILIGPFLVPIPPLEGTQPPEELADPDSHFIELGDLTFHYKTAGQEQPTLVLLHGFGSSVYSWREVMPVLGEETTVYAYDRLAFGLTERPIEWKKGDNPYDSQSADEHLMALLDAWGVEEAVLVGNSAGGPVAIRAALEHPERVSALILVSPAVGDGDGHSNRYGWLANTPQMQRLGPWLVRAVQEWGMQMLDDAWHDLDKRPQETVELYRKPLRVENWDVGLWHYSTAGGESGLRERLGELNLPILLITGDDDRIVPTGDTIALAEELPTAELVVLPECGHVPQEECPEAFLDAVEQFLATLNER